MSLLKPPAYCRFVDDIFLIVKSVQDIENLRLGFVKRSVLKFTYEIENNNKLNFLDVNLCNMANKIHTYVHVKPTKVEIA